ncbi:MAG: class I SAM-dependent methyltransferase [Acaryochloridaceae cyanobacterium RL_2_7]|nr:class I SAM-dependent methyltransferase [Acaryochloridaceae cyanobacterium RL_2_7]
MNRYQITAQAKEQQKQATKPLVNRLYACYQEFYNSDRILIDHLAARALPEILKDSPSLNLCPPSHRVAQLTSVIRARSFDQEVIGFLEQHPNSVVVNLGSRLCTRSSRLPVPHESWYEVDTSDVMSLRQRYFTIVKREWDVESDCMNLKWMKHIRREEEQPILFILEGVCMYRTAEENQRLFNAIAQKFPGAHLLFDVVSPRFVNTESTAGTPQPEDFLGESDANFSWGLGDISELESWGFKLCTGQKLVIDFKKGFHMNNHIQNMKPYGSG